MPARHGRARPAAGGEDPGRLVLARLAKVHTPEEFRPHRPTSCSRDRSPAGAEIPAHAIRLARGRAQRASRCSCANHRMAPGHWQIVSTRPTAPRARAVPHLRARSGAARADRHRGAGGAADRRGSTGRRQGEDHGFIVMEVNTKPQPRARIEDQVGKDEIWTRLLKWFSSDSSSRGRSRN